MTNKSLEIPEGYEIDFQNSCFEESKIMLKEKKSRYPMSVDEIDRPWFLDDAGNVTLSQIEYDQTPNHLSSESRAEGLKQFIQLTELCLAWNKVDDFVADWEDEKQKKYCIYFDRNQIVINCYWSVGLPLHFKSRQIAELFLKSFSKEIEAAKMFL